MSGHHVRHSPRSPCSTWSVEECSDNSLSVRSYTVLKLYGEINVVFLTGLCEWQVQFRWSIPPCQAFPSLFLLHKIQFIYRYYINVTISSIQCVCISASYMECADAEDSRDSSNEQIPRKPINLPAHTLMHFSPTFAHHTGVDSETENSTTSIRNVGELLPAKLCLG